MSDQAEAVDEESLAFATVASQRRVNSSPNQLLRDSDYFRKRIFCERKNYRYQFFTIENAIFHTITDEDNA